MENQQESYDVYDNYLNCSEYEGPADAEGFYRFERGESFYFAYLEHGRVILRSEGYTNEAGRENGIKSVWANVMEDVQYAPMQEDNGKWVLLLFARNNQEIARTCSFDTKADALMLMPGARKAAQVALHHRKEDDYLACAVYALHRQNKDATHTDFVKFTHTDNGLHYFAWINAQGTVVLRSEGYPTETARDKGMASVLANRDKREQYESITFLDKTFVILRAGNRQEIARSCPQDSLAAFWLLLAPPAAAALPDDKEDDYLLCEVYAGHALSDSKQQVALFKHGGLYYFAVYYSNGSVRLRSEGFTDTTARDEELKIAMKLIDNEAHYKTIERAGYEIKILQDSNGREVGRTCPKKRVLAAAAPAPVPPPPAILPEAAPAKFNWLWLLPLLLIPLFLLWRSCSQKTEAPVPQPVPEVAVTPPPVAAEVPHCDLRWILFEFDKYDIHEDGKAELDKIVKILQANPTYTADLRGFTDEKGTNTYNEGLSRRRSRAGKDYLIAQGIDAARIEAEALSESEPVAINTQDDSGRHFNRRLELYILDANKQQVCRSIAPDIPGNLKTGNP